MASSAILSDSPKLPASPRTGRPPDYTPEIAAAICDQLATGKSIRQISQLTGFPPWDTIFGWLERYPEFARRYARARIARAHARFESIGDTLADMRRGDIDAQEARVEIEAIKWCCAKEFPTLYGDRQTIDHKLLWDGDLTHLDESQLAKLAVSLEQLLTGKQQAQLPPGSVIDVTGEEPAE